MKFALFFLGEFMAELATAAIVTTLFLGGWKGPDFIPSEFWFGVKLVFVLFLIVWFRMTLPRLRVDQVLQFAWKGLFELTMINIITISFCNDLAVCTSVCVQICYTYIVKFARSARSSHAM